MSYENFARLTGAILLNKPFISAFENIETNPKKIKRGDLFIGDNKEDIELALENEAYGVVSTTNMDILDEEIAWFKTSSLDEVLIKLLRFSLLDKNFRFVLVNSIEIEILKKIANRENLILLENNETESYKKIINADEETMFFSTDEVFLTQIYPDFEYLPTLENIFQKRDKSLFLSNFTHKNQNYKNIKISPLFLNHLEKIISFLETNNISYDIEKLSFTSHFHPIFVNRKLQLKTFGKSEHVLICESDKSLIKEELSYLKKEASWAKSIHVDFDDLEQLKSIEFNFAIIVCEYDKLLEELEKNEDKEQTVLF